MSAVVTPPRSRQQRMEALGRANRTRALRAKLKRDLKAGRAKMAATIAAPPEWAETMKVIDLLVAAPKWGRVKACRALNHCRIAHSKTLGGLTDRQRDELLRLLADGIQPSAPQPRREAPLSPFDVRVLRQLDAFGSASATRIAHRFGLSVPVVMGRLVSMRARGYVATEPPINSHDRSTYRPTDRGREALRGLEQAKAEASR